MEPKTEPEPLVPSLLEPRQGAKQVKLEAIMRWRAAEKIATYKLTIAKQADLSNPLLQVEVKNDTFFQLNANLVKSTNYFWSVSAILPNGKTARAEQVFTFRTEMAVPNPSPAQVVYYVAPNGSDDPSAGTNTSPYKTLGYASRMVPALENDTIFLQAGTYTETEAAIIALGVNVKGAGVDKVTLVSSGVDLDNPNDVQRANFKLWYDGALVQLVSPHTSEFRNIYSEILPPQNGNQSISGFSIDGQGKKLKAGIWLENRNNVYLHHLQFKDLGQRGLVAAAGDKRWFEEPKYYLKGIKIHDCTFINAGKDLEDESLGNLNLAQLDGAEIYNIQINDNQGYGIKFIFDGYFKNTSIHDCQIEVNETDKLWGEDIALELWNLGPGNEVYNVTCNTWLSFVNHPNIFGKPQKAGENLKVHDVKMIDKDGNSSKEGVEIGMPGVDFYQSYIQNKGFGVAIWDMGRQHIRIRNNIFYNSVEKENWAGAPAIYIDNSRTWAYDDITIVNNIFDRFPIGINIKGKQINNISIHNNAFINIRNTDVQAPTGSNVVSSNNIKFTAKDQAWVLTGVNKSVDNFIADPGYNYRGNRWDTYYQPTLNCFALDRGIDVGIPYRGRAPDVGCFEL